MLWIAPWDVQLTGRRHSHSPIDRPIASEGWRNGDSLGLLQFTGDKIE